MQTLEQGQCGRRHPAPLRLAAMLLLFAAGALAPPAGAQEGYPWAEALDGAPGFGARPDLRAMESLWREPEEADLEPLLALVTLTARVRLELALARALDERRGYRAVLDPPRVVPVDPLERLRELQRDPFGAGLDGDEALAYVRLLVDGRHAVRRELALAARPELEELGRALALFEAHANGLAQLDPGNELALVAGRADLAAAHLRTILHDLEQLREPLCAEDPPPDSDQLQVAAALTRGDTRAAAKLQDLRSKGLKEAGRVRSGLDTTVFARRERETLAARERDKVRAAGISRRIHVLLPAADSERALPEDVAALDTPDRYREAVRLGQEALLLDPLLPELVFQTALAVDFASGRKASIPYFDRYLALRGVRPYEHTTTEDGDLDDALRYALFRVADFTTTGPRGR